MDALHILQKYKIGITELRALLLDELLHASEPLSCDDFKTKANKTTFYRTMEQFIEHNLVTKIELDGKGYYQLKGDEKALFVCDICHHTQGLKLPKIKNLKVNSMLIKGVCSDCEEEK